MTTNAVRQQPVSRSRRRWPVGGLLLVGALLASSAFGQAGAQTQMAALVNHAATSAVPDADVAALDDGASASAMASPPPGVDRTRERFLSLGGELVLLRDASGMEIQTRQTPVETRFRPSPDTFTGPARCVSITTAVAARVGGHRISFEPGLHGRPSPDGLPLWIDGAPTSLPAAGIALGAGGRVIGSLSGGIEVDFPDETTLIATPSFWASRGVWYLDVRVFRTRANEGMVGALAQPRRVTNATSLFDYAPGTSTASFAFPSWPPESGPCVLPGSRDVPVDPLDEATAQQVCASIADETGRARCASDVQATGEVGFAQAAQLGEKLVNGSTSTRLDDAGNPTSRGGEARFTARVIRNAAGGPAPAGTVQLVVDGKELGAAIELDGRGRAAWKITSLEAGVHHIAARYAPASGSVFLASTSVTRSHAVR